MSKEDIEKIIADTQKIKRASTLLWINRGFRKKFQLLKIEEYH